MEERSSSPFRLLQTAPDFITFCCHQMANIENQQVSHFEWVTLGDATLFFVNLRHVCTQKDQSLWHNKRCCGKQSKW
jgi:hypothetical protein